MVSSCNSSFLPKESGNEEEKEVEGNEEEQSDNEDSESGEESHSGSEDADTDEELLPQASRYVHLFRENSQSALYI